MDSYTNYTKSSRSVQSLPFHASLHSIQKPPSKPWKKPVVAPLPPNRNRVYIVEPINFRDLVQKLTGQTDQNHQIENIVHQVQQPRRLQSVVPSPLNVASRAVLKSERLDTAAPLQLLYSPEKTPLSAIYRELMGDTIDVKPWKVSENALEIGLPPSSYAWCSFPSPGTMSKLEHSTVL